MFILLSLWIAVGHARPVPPCEGEFTTDRPVLYRIEGHGRTSHLLGFSRGTATLRALPDAVQSVIDHADVVVFETRPRRETSFAPTPRLSEALSREAWLVLVGRLESKGIPARAIDGLSPALAFHLLETDPRELTKDGIDREIRRAVLARGAHVKALESVVEQERLMAAAFDVGALERALLAPPTPERAYTVARWRADQPDAYRRLVGERHRAWLPKVVARHRRRGRALFVLSRLHLYGPQGLLALLSQRGFDVRRLD